MSKSVTYIEIDVPTFVSASPEETETYRFAMPTAYLPTDIDAIPSIDSISFTPARISLGKDLGERASLKIQLSDHRHIFNGEAFTQGTFWGKWRGRYGVTLRGRALRLIRGVVGQSIDQMDTRHYVIENTSGPSFDGRYVIEAKDILKFADDDRAQAPALSDGSLAGSIDNVATSINLTPSGIGDSGYPASGWVTLGGNEVVSFTRTGDVMTIVRAQFGTTAQSHSSGDRVQLVLRYTGDDVADIIYDLLVNYAGISSSYINLSEWQAETSTYLNVIYAATIAEPTSVRKLISEIIDQAALALWWDDRSQKIRLNVLREIATDADTFDQDSIIENSFQVREQPNKRISQIWTYYGQRDPTDSGADKDNFRAVLADVDLGKEAEYGAAKIRKVSARWIETETAATRHNSIKLSRFKDPPRQFAFQLFNNIDVTPVAGYLLKWWGSQDETGVETSVPIQITQITYHPDRLAIEAEEMLASGSVVLVNIVFLFATDESVLEWTIPDDWNDEDNSVHCFGAGGGGYSPGSQSGGKGGGGGAYSGSDNLVFLGSPAYAGSPSLTVQYSVGLGGANNSDGGDTWFDGATFGAATVAAEGGGGGVSRTGGGAGGQASGGAGDTKYSGGNGGSGGATGGNRCGGGGGGAAAGPNGDGGNGGSVGSNEKGGGGGGGADGGESVTDVAQGTTGTDGGDNRFGFGGGTQSTPSGQEGGGGRGGGDGSVGLGGTGEQLWTQTVTPIVSAGPGGGGGGGPAFSSAAIGGDYGGAGGGGGGNSNGAAGANGIIIIEWREAA